MSVAPAPTIKVDDDENQNTITDHNPGRFSPEAQTGSLFPPIRGAQPPPVKLEESIEDLRPPNIADNQNNQEVVMLQEADIQEDSGMYDQNLSVNNQFLQNRERNDSGSLVGGDNKRVMSPSYQGTVEGEGGDQSNNKIQPFPGYRDAATVDREDGDEGWSEHTYDSDEEKHTRNVFFSFLGLILCCGLIIASIVILFMVSTQDMKSTPTSSVHISLLNTDLLASDPAEVTTFPRGLLVEGGYIEIKLKISDVNQNGWYVTLCDSLDKHDIKIDFMKTTGKVKLSNQAGTTKEETFDFAGLTTDRSNLIRIEILKGGYIVKVNGEEVNNDVWVTTLDYTNVDRFTVAKFNGKLVSYSIDDAPI